MMMKNAIISFLLLVTAATTDAAITRQECQDQGGTVVGGTGDGAIFEPGYQCEGTDAAPTDTVVDEPIATDGEVCCGGTGEGIDPVAADAGPPGEGEEGMPPPPGEGEEVAPPPPGEGEEVAPPPPGEGEGEMPPPPVEGEGETPPPPPVEGEGELPPPPGEEALPVVADGDMPPKPGNETDHPPHPPHEHAHNETHPPPPPHSADDKEEETDKQETEASGARPISGLVALVMGAIGLAF